jgi:tRNA pseudouridine55 synthase
MKNGVIIINKEDGLTSQAVVNRAKRILGAGKAGHTGTLDPMATGVLPVLLDRGVKASEFMLTSDKHYIATLLLGVTTDTEDVTGEVLTRSDKLPTAEEVGQTCRGFTGKIMQTPPMYSALKVDGKKLCDLARRGIEVERQPREIEIYSLSVTEESSLEGKYFLDVECSKGTYIRTLCADIGKALFCGGVMSSLERTRAGGFSVEECYFLDRLEEMTIEERIDSLIPIDRMFEDLEKVVLPTFFEKLAKSGNEIYQKKIGSHIPLGQKVAMYGEGGFFAIGEVREYPDGSAIKPIKQMVL